MENAAKALLIAGGTLTTLIVISLIVALFIDIMKISDAYESKREIQDIVIFNSEFQKYISSDESNSYLNSEDISTIVNKVNNWNNSTDDDDEKIEIKGINTDGFNEKNFIKDNVLEGTDIEFKMAITKYDEETGRVKEITINEREEREGE